MSPIYWSWWAEFLWSLVTFLAHYKVREGGQVNLVGFLIVNNWVKENILMITWRSVGYECVDFIHHLEKYQCISGIRCLWMWTLLLCAGWGGWRGTLSWAFYSFSQHTTTTTIQDPGETIIQEQNIKVMYLNIYIRSWDQVFVIFTFTSYCRRLWSVPPSVTRILILTLPNFLCLLANSFCKWLLRGTWSLSHNRRQSNFTISFKDSTWGQ